MRRFCHAKHFQSGMLAKKATWILPCKTLSKWNVGKKKPRGHISMDVPYFESVLHAKICAKFRCGLLKCWFWDAAHLISALHLDTPMDNIPT